MSDPPPAFTSEAQVGFNSGAAAFVPNGVQSALIGSGRGGTDALSMGTPNQETAKHDVEALSSAVQQQSSWPQ